jgi:hypothetical protein
MACFHKLLPEFWKVKKVLKHPTVRPKVSPVISYKSTKQK